MTIQLDLRNFKSTVSDRVPPGVYRVQIEDIDPNSTDRNDLRQMVVTARIISGDHASSELVERFPLDPSSKAMFRTVGFLNGMGIKTPRKNIQFEESRLTGRKADVVVEDNEWGGQTRSQVQSWARVKSSEAETADLDDMADEEESVPSAGVPAPNKSKAKAQPVDTSDDDDLDLDDIDL